MISKDKNKRYLVLINNYRKKLGQMMVNKDMHTDEEIVVLSQKLDKLIVAYYRLKSEEKNNV